MEEHVNELADLELAINIKTACMERATKEVDQRIADLEHDMDALRNHRVDVAAPYMIEIAKDQRRIDKIKATILDAWDGERKTMVFDAGTLKFRTTHSMKIDAPGMLLDTLLHHFSVKEIAEMYISGFNKTRIKKFIDLHPQPTVARLVSKTTVKLEDPNWSRMRGDLNDWRPKP